MNKYVLNVWHYARQNMFSYPTNLIAFIFTFLSLFMANAVYQPQYYYDHECTVSVVSVLKSSSRIWCNRDQRRKTYWSRCHGGVQD